MTEDFMLKTNTAKELFNSIKDLPIIDYHCHLEPREIAENKRFKSITELWLKGDHYKWRMMRTWGVEETFITGDADDFDKFEKWAETVENCIGNPLYSWTHLELKRYFNYDGVLCKENAREVYDHCNKIIEKEDFTVLTILDKFKVEVICTTDDPVDTLEYHKSIATDNRFKTKVLPTFRPSNVMNIDNINFVSYIQKLGERTSTNIYDYDDIIKALYICIDYFDSFGCRLSDHALDPIVSVEYTKEEINSVVVKVLNGQAVSSESIRKYKTAILHDLSLKYHDLGWVSQLHIGAMRNNNARMYDKLGADTGYDAMDDKNISFELARTLSMLDKENKLCKTIVYTLNPIYNDAIATIIACFQGDGIRGKIQFGSGWWFNDNNTGMRAQMRALANNGLIACFIGMLTDSRSFLSYPRHEYFRRIMCDFIGEIVENGEYPTNMAKLSEIARNISYHNAKEYFKF